IMSKVYKLNGAVQQYAWGKIGDNSMVAKLCSQGNSDFTIDSNQPYAELWMGAHPKAPSGVVGKNISLLQMLNEQPELLGQKVNTKFGSLPYLFKVLSVNKSLSIQAHPNKQLAQKLHSEHPDIYKDPNHKPEMAIALTPFEALCGFRPLSEISNFLDDVPELAAVVGQTACGKLKAELGGVHPESAALKECFSNVILCSKDIREQQLSQLVTRVKELKANSQDLSSVNGELLLKLNSQFPGDVGCFVIYFLNHINLAPGEALFLGANVPHAYLYGDCIECMACSDNVVRAGLTPKLVDADTLCEMLEYEPTSASERLFTPCKSSDPNETVYNPPVEDFAVVKVHVKSGDYIFSEYESASILIFISGGAKIQENDQTISAGTILFVPANVRLAVKVTEEIIAYRAYVYPN
uniref:Mannose-6-phosphate isomerase n=1 Tax=Ciona savignyi TaxID=51511 RepID=H2YYX3_CIOSA